MIDAGTQYFIYKERENELMTQIEHIRTARENGALNVTGPSWLMAVEQWLKKSFSFGKVTQNRLQHHRVSG